MGLFTAGSLRDGRLQDFHFLCQPSWIVAGLWGARNPTKASIALLNRLAQMTERMERTPNDHTCSAARWYIGEIEKLQLPADAYALYTPLRDRLWRAIHAYETRTTYECDPQDFGRLVGSDREFVLWGPALWGPNEPRPRDPLTPAGALWAHISCYCWQ
jgi:hypothetical protein